MLEQAIIWIRRVIRGGVVGAELVRCREHDLAMHGFDRPMTLDESVCQIIEQFGMAGSIPELSKVAWRADDTGAEMVLPDAVHHHARRQWIFRAGDRLRQFQTPAALPERSRLV